MIRPFEAEIAGLGAGRIVLLPDLDTAPRLAIRLKPDSPLPVICGAFSVGQAGEIVARYSPAEFARALRRLDREGRRVDSESILPEFMNHYRRVHHAQIENIPNDDQAARPAGRQARQQRSRRRAPSARRARVAGRRR